MDLLHSVAFTFLLSIVLLLSPHQVQCQQQNASLSISTHDLVVVTRERAEFTIQLNGKVDSEVNVTFSVSHEDLIDIIPKYVTIKPNGDTIFTGLILGRSPGHVDISASAQPPAIIDTKDIFVRVVVAESSDLINISSLIGWLYFVAWSISFYPQIYTNFKRKSVTGLNFDYLSLNIVGFLLYGLFNDGLYFSEAIQDEYSRRFPRGLNPVQLNDVFFAAHATFATLITIVQFFIYERGDQRVSNVGRSILGIFASCFLVAIVLASVGTIHWLDFLYTCSYIKLSITLIKYVPQAVMNYRRKSTIGWSIGNVLLDFTGGMLSMLQMMLNAYNYDDWVSIFGDPTKFGLGLFSVMFDILFLLHHYCFYRNQEPYIEIGGDNTEPVENVSEENEENEQNEVIA